MRVLFVSNHAELSGWSYQACNHILALDLAKVDVYIRRLNITRQVNPNIHPRILELEKKDVLHPDIIIQNTLPSLYEYTNRAKCVGYYVVETTNFHESGWANKINIMDAGLLPCFSNKQSSLDSGVKIPLYIVPECIDLSQAQHEWPASPVRKQHPEKYIFYAIAEWTKRKNLEALIAAFHLEFSPAEPVELFIKTTPVGMSNPQEDINNRINNVKQSLKLYNDINRYKRENVFCGFVSEADIYSMHSSLDCYVNTSRAEAFCLPCATAMAFGRTIVSPDHTGLDYLTEKNSFIVRSTPSPCMGANDALRELYTGRESWNDVDVISLRSQMRSAYEKRDLCRRKRQQGLIDVKRYSLESVGKIYQATLEKILG